MIKTIEKERRIAIALGDAGGIGPEVALKAVADELAADDSRYLLIGDESLVRSLNEQLGLRLDSRPAAEAKPADRIRIFNPLPSTIPHSVFAGGCPRRHRVAEAWYAALPARRGGGARHCASEQGVDHQLTRASRAGFESGGA